MFRAMWNAATNDDSWGFSQQPTARLCSIWAILINKVLMTRGGSSTETKITISEYKIDINIYSSSYFA